MLVFCGRAPVAELAANGSYVVNREMIREVLRSKSLLDLARIAPFIRYDKEFLRWHADVASQRDKDQVTRRILGIVTNWQSAKALGHAVTPWDLFGNNRKRVYSHNSLRLVLYEFRPSSTLRVYHAYQDGNVLFLWGGTKNTQRKDVRKAFKILNNGEPSLP